MYAEKDDALKNTLDKNELNSDSDDENNKPKTQNKE